MPSALFYQPHCGLAGDMHMAALIDLGVPEDWLRSELARLPIQSEFKLEVSKATKMGITGTHVKVHAEDAHDHRHHSTIVKMITDAGFAPGVEERALDMFQAIANAEGKIHNVPPEKVHFHEVGAVDSIIDIVGAALGIEYLNPDLILSNAVEVGAGFVNCAHGRFPVPAPATQELLAGAPCTYGGVQGESTTPTGAAILGVNVQEFLPGGQFTPQRIGYGIGHKDFEIPNVVRAVIGNYKTGRTSGQHVKIEANIDDMSPEAYEPLMQTLYAAGAADVWITPIQMKKNRPAHMLAALCPAEHEETVSDAILNHSTTIGLRVIPFEKRVLPRETISVKTTLGDVSVKVVTQPDNRRRGKPEHDDVVALAKSAGLSYSEARARIEAEIGRNL